MALHEVAGGLRAPGVRVRNRSNSAQRVELIVPAGAEVVVPDELAADMQRASTAFAVIEVAPDSGALVGDSGDEVIVEQKPKRRKG